MSENTESDIRAAGAVLWCRADSGRLLVALVHRPHHGDWSLPKGKLDPGETAPVAAIREIHEETGFTAVLGRFLLRAHYDVPTHTGAPLGKSVDYFAAHASAGHFAANSEVDELRWLPARHAGAVVSYPSDADVLERFLALPAETTTLMLVRHAKAGKREDFDGDDDLRPLSEAGVRQAEALRTMLGAFAPDAVRAAPRLRCVQTVRGCAEYLGTGVDHEPLLSEEGYWQGPELALARLRSIAAYGARSVICSQGGVIPYLVNALAEHDEVELPVGRAPRHERPLACKKSSLWLLSFTADAGADNGVDRPRLLAADYFSSPLPVPPIST